MGDIIHGDCLEVMRLIASNSIDFICADIPYGTTACAWDIVIPFDKMWKQLNRVIKPNGAIALFGSEPFSSHLRMSNIKNFKYDWIWHKNMGGGFVLAKKQPMKRHEIVSLFYKKQPTYNPQMEEYSESTKKRFKQGEFVNRSSQMSKSTNNIMGGVSLEGKKPIDFKTGAYPTSVKYFKRPNISNGMSFHPTEKPVELIAYLIKTYTNEGETVLDFTAGSGTTAIACEKTDRKYIVIEKEKKYFDIINKRIEKHNDGNLLNYG